jgi:sigma-E factor negative regulatory protein RseC
MNEEILIEEGIVVNISGDNAEIKLIENSNCEGCTTKDFCNGNTEKSIKLKNEYDLKIGERVKIEVRGKTILKIVFLLYGIPLLILILSFLILYEIIEANRELLVSTISFSLIGIYYLLVTFYLRKTSNLIKARIIKLK